MDTNRQFWKVKSQLAAFDHAVVNTMDQHTNLMTAIIVVGLCGWGIATQHIWFVIFVIMIGAAGYYLGATIALTVSFALALWSTHSGGQSFDLTITTAVFEFTGYSLIARLGVRHRHERAALQRTKLKALSHRDQVMSWQVSNHVRTSLAAVRFLLFPLQDQENQQALEQAVQELARLESIFQSMDEDRDTATHTRQQQVK